MKRIVLDTNVLISGMIHAHGAPGRIVDLVREERVELVVDDRVLAEYREVLHRPKFRRYFSLAEARDIMRFLERNTTYLVPTTPVANLPDADDAPFVELALEAKAPLITGNADHFPKAIRRLVSISSPAEFMRDWVGP